MEISKPKRLPLPVRQTPSRHNELRKALNILDIGEMVEVKMKRSKVPSLTLRDRYNRGTVIEARQVYRETSKLLPFFRGKYIIENRLLIKPDGDEQPVEVLADECYKCHDNAV